MEDNFFYAQISICSEKTGMELHPEIYSLLRKIEDTLLGRDTPKVPTMLGVTIALFLIDQIINRGAFSKQLRGNLPVSEETNLMIWDREKERKYFWSATVIKYKLQMQWRYSPMK